MRLIFTAVTAVLLLASSLVQAAALAVTIWKPIPGKAEAMLESAQAAKAIHEKLGADVTIAIENTGRLHYALGFESWTAWADWQEKVASSKEWAAWQARTNANPSAIQEENFQLDVVPGTQNPVGEGSPGNAYQVFIWDPPGMRTQALVQAAMEAKAIHEKHGVTVGINVDQLGRMHYVMNFRDWKHWAKVQDTPDPDFANFMLRQAVNPTGELVEVYTATRLP